MFDLVIVHAYQDLPLASGLGETFASQGLEVGEGVSIWPSDRITQRVRRGLDGARAAVILVTEEFARMPWPRRDLDALADHDRVVALLCGIEEEDVAGLSPRLAVAAIPGCHHEQVVRLLRFDG